MHTKSPRLAYLRRMGLHRCIWVCVMLAALTAQGQQPVFNFGLTAGWHATAITRRPESPQLSPVAAWGFNNAHGGAFIEARLRDPLYLLAEAQVSSFNTSGNYFALNEEGGVVSTQSSLRENAFMFSALFQYHVNEVRACIGFTTLLLQNSAIDAVDYTILANRRGFDFGLTTGLEVTLNRHVSVAARFIRFYGGMYIERPEAEAQARHYALQIAVRLHIRPIGRKP
jgi:hypothetical protein